MSESFDCHVKKYFWCFKCSYIQEFCRFEINHEFSNTYIIISRFWHQIWVQIPFPNSINNPHQSWISGVLGVKHKIVSNAYLCYLNLLSRLSQGNLLSLDLPSFGFHLQASSMSLPHISNFHACFQVFHHCISTIELQKSIHYPKNNLLHIYLQLSPSEINLNFLAFDWITQKSLLNSTITKRFESKTLRAILPYESQLFF